MIELTIRALRPVEAEAPGSTYPEITAPLTVIPTDSIAEKQPSPV